LLAFIHYALINNILSPGYAMADTVQDFLSASLHEQLPVTIYFDRWQMTGIVTAIREDAVEIRQENKRSVIRIDRICAVSRE
jgi:hypothetical protein